MRTYYSVDLIYKNEDARFQPITNNLVNNHTSVAVLSGLCFNLIFI